jgi:hypothetical protein
VLLAEKVVSVVPVVKVVVLLVVAKEASVARRLRMPSPRAKSQRLTSRRMPPDR